jgi:L-ascorbate metabolism protein UlaG (beta-lactamase superfamily)
MRVTKFGHSCFLVEESGVRILFDPGAYSTGQNEVKNIDAVLITHEHPDHLSPDSLKTVLANNPEAKIFTNNGAGKVLDEHNIPYSILGDGESTGVKGVIIEGFGVEHACIHESIPLIRNTGYLIAERLYYPGDALHVPSKPVEILALPVAAPWMKLSDAVDFAAKIKPKVCLPVHDGMLRPERYGPSRMVPRKVLEPLGIEFREMTEGSIEEF